jgi:ribosomal protein S1
MLFFRKIRVHCEELQCVKIKNGDVVDGDFVCFLVRKRKSELDEIDNLFHCGIKEATSEGLKISQKRRNLILSMQISKNPSFREFLGEIF